MSIGNIMNTSTAGMNVQASKLSAVSENVANADTTGYKRSETEFSSLVLPQTNGSYTSGSVAAVTRNTISESGGLSYTGNSNTAQKLDLAVAGEGFFVVGDGNGGNFVTRAGSFTMQADGTLVNTAGYTLRGYPTGGVATGVLNSFAGLQDVNLKAGLLTANPSTTGILTVPLDQSFTAGKVGSYTQPMAFNLTQTNAGSVTPRATDTITLAFTVAIDGASPTSVSLTKPVGEMSNAAIVDAINSTTGLSTVASLDSSGKIVLKSNSGVAGATSKVALAITTTFPVTAGTTGAGGATASGATYSMSGFAAFAATDTGATGSLSFDPATNGSGGTPSAGSTIKQAMTVYNNAGEAVTLDVYYTKKNDVTNEWSMAVFDGRDAATGTATAPFPYTTAPLATATLKFDATTYRLTTITPGANTGQVDNKQLAINLSAIGGGNFNLNIGETTQYFKPNTSALEASSNGNPAEVIKTISVGNDGVVTANFTSGTTRALYKIPLAKVASPDSLLAIAGNAYQVGVESGTILMGAGGQGGFGKVTAGALENSNVDLATELTNMITAQRSYTANSKVFQTGSEILDVLVNLKR